jgi:hypothetical protein
MKLPKPIDLFHIPTLAQIEAKIVPLSEQLIEDRMGAAWWEELEIDQKSAANEIDRYWDWIELEIERDGRILRSSKIAIVTGDGAVQGAAMYSLEAVGLRLEPDESGLFVELLFTAPRNRPWIRADRREKFRGVGVELLLAMAQESRRKRLHGRLKLESSPESMDWYTKRGLQKTSEKPILYEGVEYTPMELTSEAADRLLLK